MSMEEIKFITGSEKKFFDFVSKLNDKDKIALLSHKDNDGIASAVIVSKVIGNLEHISFLDYGKKMLVNLVSELKAKQINKVIITDFSLDENIEEIKEIEKFAEILSIDHHIFANDLNSEKTIFIKTESALPASYSCYYLFSKVRKIPGWIAALGIAGDRVDKYHDKNAYEIFSDFSLGEEPKGYFWKYVINLGNALIYFTSLKMDMKEIYEIIMKANKLEDLDVLDKYASEVQRELDFHMNEFENKKEEFKDMIFYHYKPKYSINSMLINAISLRDKNKTYILAAEFNGLLRVSARRQDKLIDCVRLLQDAIEGIADSTAGGHIAAAGASFPVQFFGKFKEKLFKLYDNMKH
jgi:single-stranded DNA-specific DHH superfamily exonuclease